MLYRITIKPAGAFGTPLRSDTLFGHACWAVAAHEGETLAAEMVEECRRDPSILVFSDGFPSGYLPVPMGALLRSAAVKPQATLNDRQNWKKLKKARWVRRSLAEQRGWILDGLEHSALTDDMPTEQLLQRNVIDRCTGTSLQKNGLYQVSTLWFSDIWADIDIYAKTSWSKDRLRQVVQWIFESGYGRDSSIGCGTVLNIDVVEDEFPVHPGNPCFMSLSRFVPCDAVDVTRSRWSLEAKYGKAWQAIGNQNPFKAPIMQAVPGSLFVAREMRECYGRVLENIHSDARVVENCMTIPYWLPSSFISDQEVFS